MFEGTIDFTSARPIDDGLPSSLIFPLLTEASQVIKVDPLAVDGTFEEVKTFSDENTRLMHEIWDAYTFAKHTFLELDAEQLELARNEAMVLAASQLFEAKVVPQVCVDPYGEFTFSHKSAAGYIDIGVRGERELSYHVRNDISPEDTRYDDYAWDDFHVPQELFEAIEKIKQSL